MYLCRSEENGKQLTARRSNQAAIYVQESCNGWRMPLKEYGHSCYFSMLAVLENHSNHQQGLFYMLPEVQMHWQLTKGRYSDQMQKLSPG